MIIFTTQPHAETTLVCLYGDLAPEDSVPMLTEHLDVLAASADLVIDLTELGAIGSAAVEELTVHLMNAPTQGRTVVIQPGNAVGYRQSNANPEYAVPNGASRRPRPIEER